MELGYTDFGQIRTDPDLEFLRKDPRFEVSRDNSGAALSEQCM
jgi:hypothetical protein